MANGRIKAVDLTRDMLADFETYKKQAEALYGTAEDPYSSSTSKDDGITLIGVRFADGDPSAWRPQWVYPDGTPSSASHQRRFFGRGSHAAHAIALFSVNNETGPEQSRWSQRVLEDWFAKHAEATAGSGTASAASRLAADRAYDKSTSTAIA